jgi:Cdc6-like AAA superfamily ATPase
MTRLERFRAYVGRMNPSADPRAAIHDGLYVNPPGRSVADELATRFELEPSSTQLVVGATGSGKTSDLLHAIERLKTSLSEVGDHVEYVDVSLRHDLSASQLSGVLVALAGLSLAKQMGGQARPQAKSPLATSIKAMRRHAHGYGAWFTDPLYEDEPLDPVEGNVDDIDVEGEYVHVPGVLVSPEAPLPSKLETLTSHLRTIRAAYPGESKHAVFLFDSLDRLPSPERFRKAVQDDLRVLKAAGIGVAVVGPIRFMAGTDRAITNLFDQTHFRLASDPSRPDALAFLTKVLRRRADPDFLSDEALLPLARASGGVMRDLIALSKRAGQDAYSMGHDRVTLEDVSTAIDAFGRSLAVGLDDEQVKTLRHLHGGGGFVIRGERELSLLETGRVLPYEGNRWVVHPALAPLLAAVPEAA